MSPTLSTSPISATSPSVPSPSTPHHPDTSNFLRPATHLLQPEQPLPGSDSRPSSPPSAYISLQAREHDSPCAPPSYTPVSSTQPGLDEAEVPPPAFSPSSSFSHPPLTASTSTSTSSLPPPLPLYTPSPSTEPHTLPRTLFFWGFLFPLLWVVGVVIWCMPLRVVEEDFEESWEAHRGRGEGDVEAGEGGGEGEEKKRERELLGEKVVIMRKAEVRWAKRCAIALGVFVVVVALAVVLALMLVQKSK